MDYRSNKAIGKIDDIVVDLRDMYPRASALLIKKRFRRGVLYQPWSSVKEFKEKKFISVENPGTEFAREARLSENEICLKLTFLDKQIVDISGSKVVRVNDLHILYDNLRLWLIHVDVGIKGLLRRLGWINFFSSLIRWLFGYEMRDKFISWKYVQPVTSSEKLNFLSLKVPHSKLSELHPADIADILEDLGMEERMAIFNTFDTETAADTLEEMPTKIRVQIAELMDREKLAEILVKMPMDEVVDLLNELRTETITSLYPLLPKEDVEQIRELRKHSPHTAGSLMNTEFISVSHDMTVKEVLVKIKKEAEDIESIYYIYVADEKNSLIGIVTLKQLLVEEQDMLMADLMRGKVITVEVDTHIKKVAQVFYKYNFMVVPVVDEENRLEGIITIKDALEAVFPEIKEQAEET